ncbi:MAG: ribonuclease H-like domain-containing protein [Bacteroidota bacterium]
MAKIVFDIETTAYPLESFDEVQQQYLMKFSETEAEKEEAIRKLNLSAFTAQVIAIGLLNPETNAGRVFYQSDEKGTSTSEDGTIEYIAETEVEILKRFWETIPRYDRFITFNGRGFDCPFLMLRSALLGVNPTRNLMPYRYSGKEHCDLLEQLTFYGVTRKYNLDFICKAFGIPTPKDKGFTGLELGELFRARRYNEIAEYCMGDVLATAALYRKWDEFLNFEKTV